MMKYKLSKYTFPKWISIRFRCLSSIILTNISWFCSGFAKQYYVFIRRMRWWILFIYIVINIQIICVFYYLIKHKLICTCNKIKFIYSVDTYQEIKSKVKIFVCKSTFIENQIFWCLLYYSAKQHIFWLRKNLTCKNLLSGTFRKYDYLLSILLYLANKYYK